MSDRPTGPAGSGWADELTVLTAYFNPAGYVSRKRNYETFVRQLRACRGARLVTVECAFGSGAFELAGGRDTIQVRAEHPLWIKENLLNIGLSRIETPYVAWVDGDVLFQNVDWVRQTVAALRTYCVVQPWSTVYCLDAEGRKGTGLPAFCRIHQAQYTGRCRPGCCHTGYAWAARREVLAAVGGFLDELILGGGDHLMAVAIFDLDRELWANAIGGEYRRRIDGWCRRFSAAVERRIGYVDGELHHLFHGSLHDRAYGARHAIPARYGYDPVVHLRKNADGVNQLAGPPGLGEEVRSYFSARQEDFASAVGRESV